MDYDDQSLIRVFVVDDHPIIREGLRVFFQSTPDILIVGEAGDGKAALQLALECSPDLVLLDLELPKLSGIEVARRLLAWKPHSRILVFSAHDDYQFILEVIRLGVAGYLTKDEPPERILEAIRAICRDQPGWYSKNIKARLSKVRMFEKDVGLTERELQVFRVMARGKTNGEIARELGISNKTVEKHVEKLFHKLGVFSRTEAAVRGIMSGLI